MENNDIDMRLFRKRNRFWRDAAFNKVVGLLFWIC